MVACWLYGLLAVTMAVVPSSVRRVVPGVRFPASTHEWAEGDQKGCSCVAVSSSIPSSVAMDSVLKCLSFSVVMRRVTLRLPLSPVSGLVALTSSRA